MGFQWNRPELMGEGKVLQPMANDNISYHASLLPMPTEVSTHNPPQSVCDMGTRCHIAAVSSMQPNHKDFTLPHIFWLDSRWSSTVHPLFFLICSKSAHFDKYSPYPDPFQSFLHEGRKYAAPLRKIYFTNWLFFPKQSELKSSPEVEKKLKDQSELVALQP